MGRMVVEPGSAPQWVDGYRGYRGWRRPYGSHKNYIRDKQKENPIKEDVKEILWKKFDRVEGYTDEQRARVKNTIGFQIDIFSKIILEHAEEIVEAELEDRINGYFDAVQESKETKKITEMYYTELAEKAEELAIHEYDISKNFDIEKAAQKEKGIYDKLKKGEISKYEAQRLLEEPILFENTDDRRNQEIMRAYTDFREKNSATRDRNNERKTGEERE